LSARHYLDLNIGSRLECQRDLQDNSFGSMNHDGALEREAWVMIVPNDWEAGNHVD
jgi:hypothetical protein